MPNPDSIASRGPRIAVLGRLAAGFSMDALVVPAALVGLVALVGAPPARAQVHSGLPASTLTPDARAAGMGSAFTAVAEGASALWWNPAGLAFAPVGIALSHGQGALGEDLDRAFDEDLALQSVGLVAGTRRAGLGAHLNRFAYDRGVGEFRGLTHREYAAQAGVGFQVLDRVADGSPATGHGAPTHPSAARGTPSGQRTELSVGASVKYGRIDPGIDDDVVGSGWAGDAGLLLRQAMPLGASRVTLGLGWVVRNLVDGGISWADRDEDDSFGRADRLGLSVAVEAGREGVWGPPLSVLIAAEQEEVVLTPSDAWFRHVGCEVSAFGLAAVRLGYERDERRDVDGRTYGLGASSGIVFGRGEARRQFRVHIDYAKSPRASLFGGENPRWSLAASLTGW